MVCSNGRQLPSLGLHPFLTLPICTKIIYEFCYWSLLGWAGEGRARVSHIVLPCIGFQPRLKAGCGVCLQFKTNLVYIGSSRQSYKMKHYLKKKKSETHSGNGNSSVICKAVPLSYHWVKRARLMSVACILIDSSNSCDIALKVCSYQGHTGFCSQV